MAISDFRFRIADLGEGEPQRHKDTKDGGGNAEDAETAEEEKGGRREPRRSRRGI
jgi:hypothetical protein